MGLASLTSPRVTGWHTAATYGVFGAALAASRLLDCDVEQTVNALGLAYAQAAGNVQCLDNGGFSKPLQVGFAARAGLTSAYLAKLGFTGATEVISGRYGFYHVYEHGAYRPQPLFQSGFALSDAAIKLYPCCRNTHAAIMASLKLRTEFDLRPSQISRVEVAVNPTAAASVIAPKRRKYKPTTSVDARFSLPYCVAAALTTGWVGLDDFTEEAIRRVDVLDLARKVVIREDECLEGWITPAIVEIETQETTYRAYADVASTRVLMLGWSELERKFRECLSKAAVSVPERQVTAMLQRLAEIEGVASMEDVLALMLG